MSTTRLELYNGALLLCGSRAIASLTEDREPRRILDQVWDDNAVRYCLEQGQWWFAMRTQQLEYDPDTLPQFGYSRAFNKPDDWVLTSAVCSDERFSAPLLAYDDTDINWYADLDTIYVKYVSDDDDYGNNLSKWPQTFAEYAQAFLASKIIYRLNGNDRAVSFLFGQPGKINGGELGRRLTIAKSRAAMTQPTKFPAEGSWNGSRRGRTDRDPGNRGSLIG